MALAVNPIGTLKLPALASPDALATDRQLAWLVCIAGALMLLVSVRFLWVLPATARSSPTSTQGRQSTDAARSADLWWLPLLVGAALLAACEGSSWFFRVASADPVTGASNRKSDGVWARVRLRTYECRVTYPGPDGQFDTPDDLRVAGELRLPLGDSVTIQLEADDGPHRWYVPALRTSVELRKGQSVTTRVHTDVAGDFDMVVVDLSRYREDAVHGRLIVSSADTAQQWLEQRSREQLAEQLPASEVQP
jgi:heme/copper-type cytochrome/quinol oxidase subunit 2